MSSSQSQEAPTPPSSSQYTTRERRWHGTTCPSSCCSMPPPSYCISQPRTTCLSAGVSTLAHSVQISSAHLSSLRCILLGLILFTLHTNANEFENMHPQVLTADKTQFQIGRNNFYAINMPDAKLIYSTTLEESRQIFAVSKTLDFSELSVANENLLLSLQTLTRQNYLENFDNYRFYIDTEIHLSSVRMPFRQCQRHCLKGGASMIDTPSAFFKIINSFSPDSLWINPHVNASNTEYSIYLDTIQVYPKNDLGIGNPNVYYFKDMKRKLILTIGKGYSYYSPHSESYWLEHFYRLQTAMTREGKAEIYIPEDERFLTPQEFHHYCACYRTPSISTKIFNDLKREIKHFEHQKSKLNLGIEPERLQNASMGSLLPILKPYLNENPPIKRDSPHYIEHVTPLIPQVVTHDNLLHSFMFLTAENLAYL